MADLVIDLDDFSTADTAEMEVRAHSRPTGWKWVFAGPGHEKTVAQANRIARKAIQESRAKEEARINGKTWRSEEDDIEDIRRRNVDFVVERLVGWSPIKVGDEDGKVVDFPFTPENARSLLADPKKSGLMQQALDFIGDTENFMRR